jgi:hypothetical protein
LYINDFLALSTQIQPQPSPPDSASPITGVNKYCPHPSKEIVRDIFFQSSRFNFSVSCRSSGTIKKKEKNEAAIGVENDGALKLGTA